MFDIKYINVIWCLVLHRVSWGSKCRSPIMRSPCCCQMSACSRQYFQAHLPPWDLTPFLHTVDRSMWPCCTCDYCGRGIYIYIYKYRERHEDRENDNMQYMLRLKTEMDGWMDGLTSNHAISTHSAFLYDYIPLTIEIKINSWTLAQ